MNRRRHLFLPPIVLDHTSATPLHRQICRQIATTIRGGEVPGGAHLPSSRALSKLLGVSRNTVLAAYDDLAADGLVCGERGAGMRVPSAANVPATGLFGLRQVIRASGYPAKILPLADPDGNPFYLHF